VVGINRFTVEEHERPSLHSIDPEIGQRQAQKVSALRARRDNALVSQRLQTLEHAAAGTENVMPHLIAAVEAYATLGEISDAMRHIFGEQKEFRSIK
jgi:methylmalonyl-CoA mutase, N-terminal domain